jgi:subtilase family serine protease
MNSPLFRTLVRVALAAALTACSSNSATQPFLPGNETASEHEPVPQEMLRPEVLRVASTMHRLCAKSAPGHAQCQAIFGGVPISSAATSCLHHPGCYGPSDLQAAYGISAAAAHNGIGQTVAIVDAYGYPGVQKDLSRYRAFFHLPACGAGCFTLVNQDGARSSLPPPNPSNDWRGEEALDIDMVSAICPHCHIVLVQANDDSLTNLQTAVTTALRMANIVSNSWGAPETLSGNSVFDSHPGKVITASAGDMGAGAIQPCSFAGVVCVGGTSLVLDNGARVSEVVWDGLVRNQCGAGPCATGSGCSALVVKPSWQTDSGCTMRSESDISTDADPYTGTVVACTPCESPVCSTVLCGGNGGTSQSSPMIAAMYALAGNAATATPATLWVQGGSANFNNIVKGTNEDAADGTFVCPRSYSYICKARPGYSGPSGWGTPNGLGAL